MADTLYIRLKLLTFAVDHIQDSWERMAQYLQFPYGNTGKRRPIANHIIVTVDHGGW